MLEESRVDLLITVFQGKMTSVEASTLSTEMTVRSQAEPQDIPLVVNIRLR